MRFLRSPSPCRAGIDLIGGVEIPHHGNALTVAFDDDRTHRPSPQHVEIFGNIVFEIMGCDFEDLIARHGCRSFHCMEMYGRTAHVKSGPGGPAFCA